MKEQILAQIKENIRQYYREVGDGKAPFETRTAKVPLSVPTYGADEVIEAVQSMLTTWVTMGKNVYEFERLFAKYVGAKYSTMVNSGSSANLVALSILTNPALKKRIRPGEEILTPAVTWSTTVSPIANVGAVPFLVDVDPETYLISTEEMQKHITPKTRAIMPVHLLGNPCDMKAIQDLAEDHDLYVIEDACESHGAEIGGRKVGSFGDLSTFSFFFSHHISTIEGGMVLTNHEEFSELSKALRAHGWVREMQHREKHIKENPGIDPRFLFVNYGYNLRPTDLQGGFGIHQVPKIEKFLEIRRKNADFWTKNLQEFSDHLSIPSQAKGTKHAWYGYPLSVKKGAPFTKAQLTAFMESKGIETRPLMAGNIAEQPMIQYVTHKKGDLPVSESVTKNAFFFGNHHWVGDKERQHVVDTITQFMRTTPKRGNNLRTRPVAAQR